MAGMEPAFRAHVESGITTLCRCWAIDRADGVCLGFTDHDRDLAFEGITFRAETGLSALALQQTTGLSVDNSEVVGALSDAALREEDVEAGRFDGAALRVWMVNWADTGARWLQFRGSLGEITRSGRHFRAEMRGLADALNQPLGRVYQKPCTAVLGDADCQFDLTKPGYAEERPAATIAEGRVFTWPEVPGFEPGWFARGRLTVLSGAAAGLWGLIKRDRPVPDGRQIALWEPLRGAVAPGDMLRLEAGCDKRLETCRLKFDNLLNFQGFPDIPGEDWMLAVPRRSGTNSGGSRR